MAKEETTTATEEKEKEKSVKLSSDELNELSPKEYQNYRRIRQQEASAKIQAILEEYDVAIDAEVIVGQNRIEPRIKLVDAYPKGNV